jgi:sulfur carrier protein ThiS
MSVLVYVDGAHIELPETMTVRQFLRQLGMYAKAGEIFDFSGRLRGKIL